MSDMKDWSTTAASNNSNPPDGMPEGQAPSTVNNSVRENMAATRTFRDTLEWRDWGHTYAYSSGTAFTTSAGDGDTTDVYHLDRRVKITGATTGTIYGTIIASTYTTSTLVTLRIDNEDTIQNETIAVFVGFARDSQYFYAEFPRNYMINGAMKVAQIGGPVANPTSRTWVVDRFGVSTGTSAQVTISQATTGGPVSAFPNWLKLETTTGGVTGSTVSNISYGVEGYDYQNLRNKVITLSFWVKAPYARADYEIVFKNGANNSYYWTEYEVFTANTWEFKTVTLTLAETYGTWYTDYRFGLGITWVLGSDESAGGSAKDQWNSGFFTCNEPFDLLQTTGNIFGLTGVQLQVGPSAVDLIYRPFTEELLMCQRYYQKSFEYGVEPEYNGNDYDNALETTINTSGVARLIQYLYPHMRDTPSVTWYNPRTGGSISRMTNGTIDDTGTPTNKFTPRKLRFESDNLSIAAGTWYLHWQAQSEYYP